MESPLQVVFHDLERSDAIEEAVRKHAADLDNHFDRITSCRVVVGAPHVILVHGADDTYDPCRPCGRHVTG